MGFPDAVTPELMEDEQFLKQFHHALLEVRSPRLAKAGRAGICWYGDCSAHVYGTRIQQTPGPHCLESSHAVSSVPRGMAPKQLSSRRGPDPLVVWTQLHVEEGQLICPESGRRFPIQKGIPNMLLNEDEC